jgi:methionine sulfoxide reductase heme-binding subunit
MNDAMWYLSRATGIVAAVLAVVALAWGFLFSARATGTRRRPNWWLDLHNWLGGAALVFTLIHIATSYVNADAGLTLAELFVPGVASANRFALSWGVIATYLFATTVLTSWPRRLFSRRTWRIVHLGSVVGVALALVHGFQMGSEASGQPFQVLMLLIVAIGTYTLGIRVAGVALGKRAATRTSTDR